MKRSPKLEPYLYMLPAVLILAFVFLYPLLEVIRFSFLDLRAWPGTFIRLANYRVVLKDGRFYESLLHNVELLLTIPVMAFIALLVAVLLHEQVHGWRFYRSLLLIPYVVPIVAIGIAMSHFFKLHGGLNQLLELVGLGFLQRQWLVDVNWALPSVAVVIIWRELGFGAVLFLARLGTMPVETLEAARLDGAGWWRRLWRIIAPELTTVIEFYVIINIIAMLSQIFPYVFVMTGGGPGYATWVTELYIYKQAFQFNMMGASAVVAVILLAITVAFIALSFRFRERLGEQYG
jgi:ABC-type sugar transport system permease subunit